MKISTEKIKKLIVQIEEVIEVLKTEEEKFKQLEEHIHPNYLKSAQNLIHYTAFRKTAKKNIQNKLRVLGLTNLGNHEGHILTSLLQVRFILYRLLNEFEIASIESNLSIKKGRKLLKKNGEKLFGKARGKRRVQIMVTQPTDAAYNFDMVHEMIVNGMDCARINCAHDNPIIWSKIIENIRKASQELGKDIKIAMDLAGPKIRTGKINSGPQVRKFRPLRDEFGKVLVPAEIILKKEYGDQPTPNTILIDNIDLEDLKVGSKLVYRDTRGKSRNITISKASNDEIIATSKKTIYIASNTSILLKGTESKEFLIKQIVPKEPYVLLKQNDILIITKEPILGESAIFDDKGELQKAAHISCQLPEIFGKVVQGKKILFDDGKIEGLIESVHPDSFEVRIIRAAENGSKLKSEKGINFPDSNLGISGLTNKDKKDLEFVVKHADMVNFSFVNSKKDVQELFVELKRLEALNKLDIILKIETSTAHDNLKDILLEAMKVQNIGVMIARGDLAIETGWDTIGKVQESILSICSAAHIPVIWATQVLENLAKTGLPSRSEITDAITSLQAECVMLNKGPYINEAIKLLDTILSDMERFHDKNQTMLPRMENILKK